MMTAEEFITIIEGATGLKGEDIAEVHIFPDHIQVKVVARDVKGRAFGPYNILCFPWDDSGPSG